MKAKLYLITLLFSFKLMGQQGTLVFHTSFEIDSSEYCVYTGCNCPNYLLESVSNNVFSALNSPDIFSPCYTPTNYPFKIPVNFSGNQFPFSGSNYIGLITVTRDFFVPSDYANYREWAGIKLISPLKPGTYYRVEYFVSPADSVYQLSIPPQVYFNTDSIKFTGFVSPANYDTIDYSKVLYADSSIYINTNEWYKISGIYYADGTEKFLYVGNFIKDEDSPIIWSNTSGSSIIDWPYYYIDDLSIYELDSLNSTEENIIDKKLSIYPNPTTGIFTVQLPNILLQNARIEVFNMTGSKVYTTNVANNPKQIVLPPVADGVYYLRVWNNNQVIDTRKLVVVGGD